MSVELFKLAGKYAEEDLKQSCETLLEVLIAKKQCLCTVCRFSLTRLKGSRNPNTQRSPFSPRRSNLWLELRQPLLPAWAVLLTTPLTPSLKAMWIIMGSKMPRLSCVAYLLSFNPVICRTTLQNSVCTPTEKIVTLCHIFCNEGVQILAYMHAFTWTWTCGHSVTFNDQDWHFSLHCASIIDRFVDYFIWFP